MAIRIYDTRTRSKRELVTLEEGKVGLYACGITPYSPSHIGHARQAISFDIIVRWLRNRGFQVNYITNFTDVDDKIISVANEEGVDYLEVANRNIDDYFRCMDSLNVIRADAYPRVTETIPDIIEMISQLLDKGHAYEADDGVYFEIDTSPEKYGLLTGQTLDMVRAGAGGRVSKTGAGKRDHRDFALWKLAKVGEPAWESPWGEGRPGWHIECSAMSLKHLGERFDIHGGGSDLIFPHHEAEIFQSECCLGHEPVVQYWVHNGMINVDGEKMSKSLGNFWTISDALGKVDPLILRYALINAPYRQPVDFNQVIVDDSESHHNRMFAAYRDGLMTKGKGDWGDFPDLVESASRFESGMDDDFNTRIAIVEVQNVTKILRALLEDGELQEKIVAATGWISNFAGDVLGLLPEDNEIISEFERTETERVDLAPIVERLLEKREEARLEREWERADRIRDELSKMGVVVEDGTDGATWRLSD
ncbi:MAG: cysteine--tRNA ligase [Euryarchaeota archaeon]|nr:cysteine--tRNA ligase [Euryarchaeota archaeon]|tara:strand:+ start:1645 stop:3081 length:1437 start_codon:yes stop_codon:yes gene_type:complete